MDNFGTRLKAFLKYREITQKDMAKKIGISPSTLNGYVKGTREPDLDTINRITDVLNITTDSLLSHNDNKSRDYLCDKVYGKGDEFLNAVLKNNKIPEEIFSLYISGLYDFSENEIEKIAKDFRLPVSDFYDNEEKSSFSVEPTDEAYLIQLFRTLSSNNRNVLLTLAQTLAKQNDESNFITQRESYIKSLNIKAAAASGDSSNLDEAIGLYEKAKNENDKQ